MLSGTACARATRLGASPGVGSGRGRPGGSVGCQRSGNAAAPPAAEALQAALLAAAQQDPCVGLAPDFVVVGKTLGLGHVTRRRRRHTECRTLLDPRLRREAAANLANLRRAVQLRIAFRQGLVWRLAQRSVQGLPPRAQGDALRRLWRTLGIPLLHLPPPARSEEPVAAARRPPSALGDSWPAAGSRGRGSGGKRSTWPATKPDAGSSSSIRSRADAQPWQSRADNDWRLWPNPDRCEHSAAASSGQDRDWPAQSLTPQPQRNQREQSWSSQQQWSHSVPSGSEWTSSWPSGATGWQQQPWNSQPLPAATRRTADLMARALDGRSVGGREQPPESDFRARLLRAVAGRHALCTFDDYRPQCRAAKHGQSLAASFSQRGPSRAQQEQGRS